MTIQPLPKFNNQAGDSLTERVSGMPHRARVERRPNQHRPVPPLLITHPPLPPRQQLSTQTNYRRVNIQTFINTLLVTLLSAAE
jgi:hypothetical protein